MVDKLILISRFNMPHPIWKERTHEAYAAWIRDRINLFRDLTVRSLRNCYNKPDLWLIMIDDRVINVTEELNEITKGLPVRLVQYSGKRIVPAVQEALSDLDYPLRLITCRTDTDDLLASGIFQGYRNAKVTDEQASNGITLSFPGGAIYDRANDKFYLSSYPENPFLGFLEDVKAPEDMRTVYMSQHTDMINDSASTLSLRSYGPQWASVVHEDNLGNHSLMDVANFAFADTDKIKKLFGIG